MFNTMFCLILIFLFFYFSRQIGAFKVDPDLGFMIQTCFISANSNPNIASDYTLIENICPTDDTVKYYSQRDLPISHSQTDNKRFSFTFNSHFNESLLFLHCEMSVCSKRPHNNQGLAMVCFSFSPYLFYFLSYLTSLAPIVPVYIS
ncbi:unnamed protein product [Oncorhynchus mykiss]|uniref:ZP domain-containing protein n=1 Tax=Oncorhynchus mykiss TaxID=8022 RepID=A0A060Z612_ONCMY|nr:unnamed protein product [Oncorhynchus mykiss]